MTGLSSFITDLGDIITLLVTKFTEVLTMYTSSPVLGVIFAIGVVSAVVGLGHKMLGRHA